LRTQIRPTSKTTKRLPLEFLFLEEGGRPKEEGGI